MKTVTVVLLVLLLTSAVIAGCPGVLTGSGNVETRQFSYRDFNRVDVSSAFTFEIVQSSSYGVSITADDNLFEYIQVSKAGETLKIGLKTINRLGPVTLQATVSMPQLHGLEVSGASHGSVLKFRSKENLDIGLSGASSLELEQVSAGDVRFEISGASKAIGSVTVGYARFELSGASTVQLEGSADDIVVDASGASRVSLGDFSVNNADIEFSGASNGKVNPSGRLDADLSGASKLSYIGEPTIGKINTSGGSSLSKQ